MTPPLQASPFEHDAAEAVMSLRDALQAWVRGLEGPVTTASELQRATRLDMKLCWKVFRMLESRDAMSAAVYVPGQANLRALTAAVMRHGGERVASKITAAAARFDHVVARHAGDRHSFDTMASQWSSEQVAKLDVNHRRAAFRANRHIWGMQAEAHISCYIMCTSSQSDDLLDGALISSRVGLQRLRRGTTPLFSQLVGVSDDDGVIRRPLGGEPLDPENAGDLGFSIVRDFCSENLPHIETQRTADGYMHATLPADMIGLTSAVTITTGHLTPAFAGRWRDEHNAAVMQTAFVQIPAKTLVLDLIVQDETFGPIAPRGEVYADRTGRLPFPQGDQRINLLSEAETVVRLGRGTRVLGTPLLDRYPQLIERALSRLGLDPARCTAFRCRIEYPVMLSRAVMTFPLGERPREEDSEFEI